MTYPNYYGAYVQPYCDGCNEKLTDEDERSNVQVELDIHVSVGCIE